MTTANPPAARKPRCQILAAAIALALAGMAMPALAEAPASGTWASRHGVKSAAAFPERRAHSPLRRRSAAGSVLAAYPVADARGTPRAPARLAVTSLADAGAGSLRATLAGAVPGDVVDLTGLHGRIELQSALVSGAEGVEIRGPGADELVLDASGHDRVLVSRGALALSGLTLRGGVAPTGSGGYGGCQYHDGPLTLTDVVIEDCVAGSSAEYFAGGGGVFANGKLTMSGSTVRNNHAVAKHVVFGGGLVSYGLALSDSIVSGNHAEQADVTTAAMPAYYDYFRAVGGGIATDGWMGSGQFEELSIVSSTVTGNLVSSPGGFVANYYNPGASYRVPGQAAGGGAYSRGPTSVKYSSVSDNAARADGHAAGGGLHLYGGGSANGDASLVKYSSVTGNLAGLPEGGSGMTYSVRASGAGIYGAGGLVVGGSAVAGNTVDMATCLPDAGCAAVGGGILVWGDQLMVALSTVSGNTARIHPLATQYGYSAGAGIAMRAASLVLHSSTISGNRSLGGGAYAGGLYSGEAAISSSTIAFNHADTEGGGAFLFASGGDGTQIDSTIIARNTEGAGAANDVRGDPIEVEGAGNLVEASLNVIFQNAPLAANPVLGALAFNGGQTKTHALLDGSPALDAGILGGLDVDQRGYRRVAGLAPDIGAFERDDDRIFTDGFQPRLGGP